MRSFVIWETTFLISKKFKTSGKSWMEISEQDLKNLDQRVQSSPTTLIEPKKYDFLMIYAAWREHEVKIWYYDSGSRLWRTRFHIREKCWDPEKWELRVNWKSKDQDLIWRSMIETLKKRDFVKWNRTVTWWRIESLNRAETTSRTI